VGLLRLGGAAYARETLYESAHDVSGWDLLPAVAPLPSRDCQDAAHYCEGELEVNIDSERPDICPGHTLAVWPGRQTRGGRTKRDGPRVSEQARALTVVLALSQARHPRKRHPARSSSDWLTPSTRPRPSSSLAGICCMTRSGPGAFCPRGRRSQDHRSSPSSRVA
jgi:hypothetical protein